MKKRLKIFVFFGHQTDRTKRNPVTGRYEEVKVDLYQIMADITGLDDVDAHFLSKIVHSYLDQKEDIYNTPGYDGVWARGLKEFMWRIGYEIEFVNIDHKEGVRLYNEFSSRNPFGWLDFRSGYPRYEHRE